MLRDIPKGTHCFIDANIFLSQLLTNDAVTTAILEKLRLKDLATNDDDFGTVVGLSMWKPR